MRLVAGAATDIGLVREANEDAYLLEEPLFAVADGMGGHRGGDVASRLALETIEAMFRRGHGTLAEQVREANRAVFERSTLDRAVSGMGTTLTAALFEDGRARLAHVGDSRAYLLREGRLRMLTEDHTLVHRMVQQGEITQAEAERHPQRSVITRALGVEMSVAVDETIVDLRPGDRILICSDGLTSMVDDGSIEALLEREPDPQRAAESLVRAANDAGGVDNTTVVVVALEDGEGDEAAPADRETAEGPAEGQSEDAPEEAGRRHDTLVTPPGTAGTPVRGRPRTARASWGRPPWRRIAVAAFVLAAVVVLALVGLRLYLDSQWYVGVADGRVAIFSGIPTEVAGFDLHHVVVETTIPAAEAERLALYRTELPTGITAADRTAAEQIVQQIRSDVAAASRPSANKDGT